ncbi:trans-sialidase [Trypanosoma cruzi cruzi]|uniref:Putative trans-sialidase, Group V n=1 Tax=Trypanosoma cruzi TaxID=5693 RepID=A0A2V2V9L1_TRYCR|nr:trans-sialidase [Trypanosoma cruzi cruzi]PWU93080.1 putative trans-sialidase, Group V [Trypanosoma cruzi]
MLPRFAAVKAPRTHNRRRVTGSSGRRREGRESEPQRRNMPRHLFYSAVLLLLVVMTCCGSGAAPSSESSKGKRFVWRNKKDEETVSSLRAPSLVEMNGDVFAVAEAEGTKNNEDFTGIASELLMLTGEQASMELDKAKLNTQLLEKCSSDKGKCASQIAANSVSQSEKRVDVARPTTVVKESEIYMLAGIYNLDDATDTSAYWGLLLSRGNVSVDKESKKRIHWNDVDALQSISNMQKQGSLTDLIGGGGSGVKMKDGTIVFPVEGIKSNVAAGGTNTVSLIIYSLGNEGWKLSKGMSADGCSDPSVVEWEKDKLMMMTACDDGRRRVYESVDKGESWTEALGTLSRVWGNKKGEKVEIVGSGFTTATVGDDNKKVMLVTLPVYAKNGEENGNGKLHLWLTDNTHIVDIGPVSDENAAASSLLYKSAGSGDKKEELIALYEKKGDGKPSSYGMVSVRLTEQLQRVKEVLKTWKKVDDIVSKLCPSESSEKSASPDGACRIAMPTKGLVGFLSGNFSENTWRDEYLGVNATVKVNDVAEQVKSGVKFTGRGAGAEWPVGEQGENQLYHFANYEFTLVATVSIDGKPKENNPIPLMGVKMSGDGKTTKLMELSYDSEKKWQLLCGGKTTKENSNTWEKEKTQHVVLLIRNGSQVSAYVDGKQVGEDVPRELENTHSKGISHFYIGGDGENAANKESREGVSVTVTNVLLYNRPLSSEEIGAIDPNKDSTPSLEKEAAKPSTVSSASIIPPAPPVTPNAQKAGNPSTAGTQLTEQGESMGSSGAGSGGASAPAVSTVSTPSAEEESVVQVTSGTSPDGTQTVGGGSTADGEPTMETREGGTNGQKEKAQPLNREENATALNSSLVNLSQGNNTDAGNMRESGMVPSLLLLLLGLLGLAAL